MPDWTTTYVAPNRIAISTYDPSQLPGYMVQTTTSGNLATATAWTTANTAIYMPIYVEIPFLAQKIAVAVGTTDAAGHIDVGIYGEKGARLVSTGSTATGASSTLQVLDITDTWLMPGTYFVAMNSDSTTNTFAGLASTVMTVPIARSCGIQIQAVGAITLPNPATFATYTARFCPNVLVAGVPTL